MSVMQGGCFRCMMEKGMNVHSTVNLVGYSQGGKRVSGGGPLADA